VNIATDEDQIYLDPKSAWSIELLDGLTFLVGMRNIRVSYNAGLDDRAIQDIKIVALEMIQVMWDESKQGGDMLAKVNRNIGEGGGTSSYSLKDINPRWNDVFAKYVRYGV
jgi:hypothetical protein